MKFQQAQLPSNRTFGFFFALVFAIVATYCSLSGNWAWAYGFATAFLVFLVLAIVKAEIFLPLNKLWTRFGLLLGMFISPLVLGVVFFGLFTPMALAMRLSGRDELRLKLNQQVSHWVSRSEPIKSESFKYQF